jgi:hypothetical protein
MIKYLCILFFLFNTPVYSQFLLVNIEIKSEKDLQLLSNSNLEFHKSSNNSYIAITNQYEYDNLIYSKFDSKILISDLEKYYEEILLKKSNAPKFQSEKYFRTGTMGGYFKLNEIYSEFDRMIESYPEFVKKSIIGYSIENRPIYSYQFGNIDSANKSPQVLITSLTHAREPGTVFATLYYFWDLFSKFDKNDKTAGFILNNRSISLIPVVNPDGVYFNEFNSPNGGGMWRKNRRKINDSIYGIDINRNFGPFEAWNSPNGGSSLNPNTNTYRGTAPFSEPETEAIKNLVESKSFKTALNIHTYGNSVFFPFSYLTTECPDSVWYRGFLEGNFRHSRYIFGLDNEVINYPTRGSADDFLYLGNENFSKIYSMTSEIGSLLYEFWAPIDTMMNYAERNVKLIENVILSAVQNIALADKELVNIDGKFLIKLTLQNIGISKIENTKLNISSIDNKINILNPEFLINSLDKGEKFEYYIEFAPKNFKNGDLAELNLTAHLDFEKEINFSLPLYQYEEIDVFDINFANNWNLESDWNFETIDNELILQSNSDSVYKVSQNSFATYNFDNFEKAINRFDLRFEHEFSIESNFDFGVVWAGESGSENFNPNLGEDLVRGINPKGGMQTDTLFGFQGEFKYWKTQNLHLAENGKKIDRFAFNLRTDKGLNKKGWKIKNLRLRIFPDLPSSVNEKTPNLGTNLNIYTDLFTPNIIYIQTDNILNNAKLEIYSLNGLKIFSDEIDLNIGLNSINVPQMNSGFYSVILNSETICISRSILVIH